MIDRVNMDAWRDWEAYERVNRQFAQAVAAQWREGDRVWVHDYQLMLLPAMLRAILPHVCIGFFLHIPFPSLEVFRTLPWRKEVVEGLLGADVIGFHTYGYQRHFASCLLRMMGLDVIVDEFRWHDRTIRLGSFPISIDTADFIARASEPAAEEAAARIIKRSPGVKLLLGVDRLDYSKGIPRRFLAVERLLEIDPTLAGRFRLVQVAAPMWKATRNSAAGSRNSWAGSTAAFPPPTGRPSNTSTAAFPPRKSSPSTAPPMSWSSRPCATE
jgi:trehalose 6-phosphate synthase/phosphatase